MINDFHFQAIYPIPAQKLDLLMENEENFWTLDLDT